MSFFKKYKWWIIGGVIAIILIIAVSMSSYSKERQASRDRVSDQIESMEDLTDKFDQMADDLREGREEILEEFHEKTGQ